MWPLTALVVTGVGRRWSRSAVARIVVVVVDVRACELEDLVVPTGTSTEVVEVVRGDDTWGTGRSSEMVDLVPKLLSCPLSNLVGLYQWCV